MAKTDNTRAPVGAQVREGVVELVLTNHPVIGKQIKQKIVISSMVKKRSFR